MSVRHPLVIRVNQELSLDAGWWEEVSDEEGDTWRHVHPPDRPLFQQVLDYLSSFPPVNEPYVDVAVEAVATTAICLRSGTYLTVLMDHDKPLWAEARQKERRRATSRISDGEMARINIEASAALERWIEIVRTDRERYWSLVHAAHEYLPMTRWSVQARDKADRVMRRYLMALSLPDVGSQLTERLELAWGQRAYTEIKAHPTRVLANAFINASYRNGPIEGIHGGKFVAYPLEQRRIIPSEERILVQSVSYRLSGAILATFGLMDEYSGRDWTDKVLPYHLASNLRVTPSQWSLEDTSREVHLFGAEPSA